MTVDVEQIRAVARDARLALEDAEATIRKLQDENRQLRQALAEATGDDWSRENES